MVYAVLSGVAVLGNWVSLRGRLICFVGSMWYADGKTPLKLCLRYFNKNNTTFPQTPQTYVFQANIALSVWDARCMSLNDAGGDANAKFDLVGDIVPFTLFPVNLTKAQCRENPPIIRACGVPDNLGVMQNHFLFTATQYTSALGDVPVRPLSVFKADICVGESHRWAADNRPAPNNRNTVTTVVGAVTGIQRNLSGNNAAFPTAFDLTASEIYFVGQTSREPGATTMLSPVATLPDSASALDISFDDDVNSAKSSSQDSSGGCVPGSSQGSGWSSDDGQSRNASTASSGAEKRKADTVEPSMGEGPVVKATRGGKKQK